MWTTQCPAVKRNVPWGSIVLNMLHSCLLWPLKTSFWELWQSYAPSISSQCPVSTQMSTNITEREKDRSSARVKRPQQPNEILQLIRNTGLLKGRSDTSKNLQVKMIYHQAAIAYSTICKEEPRMREHWCVWVRQWSKWKPPERIERLFVWQDTWGV